MNFGISFVNSTNTIYGINKKINMGNFWYFNQNTFHFFTDNFFFFNFRIKDEHQIELNV